MARRGAEGAEPGTPLLPCPRFPRPSASFRGFLARLAVSSLRTRGGASSAETSRPRIPSPIDGFPAIAYHACGYLRTILILSPHSRVLKLLSRNRSTPTLPVLDLDTTPAPALHADVPRRACALSACAAGSRATVLAVGGGESEACRLRALGLCEGASVNVVRSRDCTLLEVRGSRLALSSALASGITVLPAV